ncbi:MAG: hypothetical protein RMY32_024140 [Nostoc sp. ChiSLP03a]|nr:hypothetical protein [Nostoc sp. ChiSLP03a]MDZ8215218.1 hypothetical protein [Nostoc sp. ChiSLP03a]
MLIFFGDSDRFSFRQACVYSSVGLIRHLAKVTNAKILEKGYWVWENSIPLPFSPQCQEVYYLLPKLNARPSMEGVKTAVIW